jgi:siroheme synthase (precorrin-2 oxidase/ferrochelatase)
MQRKGSLENRQKLNRFFFKDNAWYVEIREGVKGPFPRREDASQFLARYVHDKRVRQAVEPKDEDNALSQVITYSESSLGSE